MSHNARHLHELLIILNRAFIDSDTSDIATVDQCRKLLICTFCHDGTLHLRDYVVTIFFPHDIQHRMGSSINKTMSPVQRL